MEERPDHSDPMWDTRRKIMLRCMYFSGGYATVMPIILSADKISAAALLFGAVAAFVAPVLLGYMGIAEWGSIKKATTVTEVIKEPAIGPPSVVTTTETKTDPTAPTPRLDLKE